MSMPRPACDGARLSHFPRGDAASLMIALNSDDKITGVTLMSMAGD
jgi:hypothetical protein